VIAAVVLFWGSLAALAWTHALYPGVVALAARVRTRRVALDDAYLPSVAVIVTAYNEESAIERRLENLRALDYPPELLELVVTSDASTDRTEELAQAAGARVIRNPRGGKVAAQDAAVRATQAEVVAFSDANATWAPDALRRLIRNFADLRVAYVCGRLRLEAPDGSNKEGLYWRYELVTREGESRLGSITAGNGAIYALRRSDYVEVDPRFGHDLALPYRMVQRGRRAIYEPAALAFERPTPTNESEYRRKVRMFEHAWLIVLRGRMLRSQGPGYLLALLSHRHLRYASGLLHLILLGSSIALLGHGTVYAVFLGLQLGLLAAALAGVGLARYYVLITWATVAALWNYLRRGVPATWAPQREGELA
jgi:cellulose synthase/poly-beta-1,6-N-acetylglucosamine synthase-like glycosyltransferase